jgi:hypothetical protein
MILDKETKELVDKFVQGVELKENELVDFNNKVDEIIKLSEQRTDEKIIELDSLLDAGEISEEEYKQKFDYTKQEILRMAKEELEKLINSLS